jgi:hypothetical protein
MTTAFTIIRGDDEILDLAFKEPDGVTPLNLAGATGIWFTAKHHPKDSDADAVIRKALGVGISIVSEAAGTATVTIDAEDTADARPGVLAWDAQVRDAAGKIRTAASGSMKLAPDLTRAPHEVGVPVLLPPLPDTDGDVLTIVGGIPVWAPPTGGSDSGDAGGGGGSGSLALVEVITAADFVPSPNGFVYRKTFSDAYPSGALPTGFVFKVTTPFTSTDGIGGPAGTGARLMAFMDPNGSGTLLPGTVPADVIAETVASLTDQVTTFAGVPPSVVFADSASNLAVPVGGVVTVYALYDLAVPAAGPGTIKSIAYAATLADFASFDGGGLLLDQENDPASIGVLYLDASGLPDNVLLFGARFDFPIAWDYVGPAADPDTAILKFALGPRATFDADVLQGGTETGAANYAWFSANREAPTTGIPSLIAPPNVVKGTLSPDELALVLLSTAMVGGNSRVQFADIAGGSVKVTLFYLETA